MGVFAEHEKSIIQERVKAGLARAKTQGARLGRPPAPPIKIAKVKALREQELSIRKIAKRVGISRGKVHSIVY